MSTFLFTSYSGGSGVQGVNTVQAFWDQPGVSPIAGANSAQAFFPPMRDSVGVIGWWIWFAVAPSPGDSVLCRLFRYRYNGGYTVTQISSGFTITSASTYQIYDLTSLLLPSAASFNEVANEDHLAIGATVTGNFTLRALNQRVQFGVP